MLLENFLRAIGKNISYQRKLNSLNQTQVAEKAGFSYRYYQKIESGGANMTMSTLYRLARFFNVHPMDLINGEVDRA